MNWSNSWNIPNQITVAPKDHPSVNPWDNMSQDELLVRHQQLKDELSKIKETEMEMRKYIVKRAFPNPKEGMNTIELGNGYDLKAGVKFNYNLMDNNTVEKTLDKICKIGNEGPFIADRLVSWTPSFLLTEFRNLQEQAEQGNESSKQILALVNEMLIITDAAPTLDIKAPKVKK